MMKREFFTIVLGCLGLASAGGVTAQPTLTSSATAGIGAGGDNFRQYLAQLQQQTRPLGFDETWLDSQFSRIKRFKTVSPAPVVKDEAPATLETFLPNRFSQTQINQAMQLLDDHGELLAQLENEYGIQPRFLIALWGVVSDFQLTSSAYPLLSVTSSLAYEQQGDSEEVVAALRLLAAHNLDSEELLGERDGKLAKSGFTPSMLLEYGRDGDKDGKVDHRNSVADVLASYANFLSNQGWNSDQIWGRQVKVPQDYAGPSGIAHQADFVDWQSVGVRRFNGQDLPNRADMQPSLVQPDGAAGRSYLVYDNYRALLAWDQDHYFALSVSYLSERIRPGKQ